VSVCERCVLDLDRSVITKEKLLKYFENHKTEMGKKNKFKKFDLSSIPINAVNRDEYNAYFSLTNTNASINNQDSDDWSDSELMTGNGFNTVSGTLMPEPSIVDFLEKEMMSRKEQEKRLKIPCKKLFKYYKFEAKVLGVYDIREIYVRETYEDVYSMEEAFLKEFQENCKTFNPSAIEVPCYFLGSFGVTEINDTWYRCKVVKIIDKLLQIFLVDAGRYEYINHLQLKPINDDFRKHPQIAIKCCLADIMPLQENNDCFPQKAIEEFRSLVTEEKHKVKILLTKELKSTFDDSPIPACIEIYNIGMNKKINFNAVMVKKLKCAISCGEHSQGSMVLTESDDESQNVLEDHAIAFEEEIAKEEKLKKRVLVKILHVKDPTNFYVQLMSRDDGELFEFKYFINNNKKYLSEISKLNRKLKKYGEMKEPKQWNSGDYCLVNHSSAWHRGIISKVQNFHQYFVHLIDIGLEILTTNVNITTLPDKFKSIPRGAINVHLDAFPTLNREWGSTAIDTFKMLTNSFDSYLLSVIGLANEKNSYPVLLWGIGNAYGILGAKPLYSILLYLVNEGYAYTTSKTLDNQLLYDEYLIKESTFEISVPDLVNTNRLCQDIVSCHEKTKLPVIKVGNLSVEITPKKISSWIPAKERKVGDQFRGRVTYVDHDGALYICDNENIDFMVQMPDKNTSIYNMMASNNVWEILKPKDPVIVPYKDGSEFF
jgi:Tudor domain